MKFEVVNLHDNFLVVNGRLLMLHCYPISVFRVIISVYYELVILHDTFLSMRRQHKICFEVYTVLRNPQSTVRGYLLLYLYPKSNITSRFCCALRCCLKFVNSEPCTTHDCAYVLNAEIARLDRSVHSV